MDQRVLGYATVISACNPAIYQANLSFSFLLAVLTLLKEAPSAGRVFQELGKRSWWLLLLVAFLLIGLSVPFWPMDLRSMMTELKQAFCRLGYLVALPLAVALTLRTPRDGVRAVSLLCLMSAAFLAVFYFLGQPGSTSFSVEGGDEIGFGQFIGNISLIFTRTQVSIPLAALTASALALAIGFEINLQALPFYLVSVICVILIMLLASTGSAFAMVCGLAVVVLGYFRNRLSPSRILLAIIFFLLIGTALYWAVFQTENALSARIEQKTNAKEIDRMVFWKEGIAEISKTPFGEGWSYRTGHSDWLLFLLSYGWLTGLAYFAAASSLFLSMWRALGRRRDAADHQSRKLLLVGLATLTVYSVNSILDMLSSNSGYYETVWALILTPATVVAVADTAKRTTRNNVAYLSLLKQRGDRI
jgi:O-antigen ligase